MLIHDIYFPVLIDFTIVKVYTFSLLCSCGFPLNCLGLTLIHHLLVVNGRERKAAVPTRPRADSEVLTLGIMAAGTTSRSSPTMHWSIKKDDASVGEC